MNGIEKNAKHILICYSMVDDIDIKLKYNKITKYDAMLELKSIINIFRIKNIEVNTNNCELCINEIKKLLENNIINFNK